MVILISHSYNESKRRMLAQTEQGGPVIIMELRTYKMYSLSLKFWIMNIYQNIYLKPTILLSCSSSLIPFLPFLGFLPKNRLDKT